jgi:hypothetical protein
MTDSRRAVASALVATTPPPCRVEPDRWFDRAHRTHALSACLACPARRWCAREALRIEPSWGMWAGIWIDGRLADAVQYLQAIASDTPVAAVAPAGAIPPTPPPPPEQHAVRGPMPQTCLTRSVPRWSVASAVLARSSGQCEVMADGCRLIADARVSRMAGASADDAVSAAAVYASCARCAETVRTTVEPSRARRLGYLLDSPAHAPEVPFYWRGCRWVLLDGAGRLLEITPAAETARAS